MRISSKGRFAISAMIDVALREAAGPVALATIGRRQRISLSYLEQLFGALRTAGLVASSRGPGGGYRLGRDAADISVADIVLAVDAREPPPLRNESPALTSVWRRLEQAMCEQMAAVSLLSLAEQQRDSQGPIVVPARRPALPPRPVQRAPRTRAPNSVFAFAGRFTDPAAG